MNKNNIGVTYLVGRPTKFVWSFHCAVVVDVLVADQLKFFLVFHKTFWLPE